MKRLVAGVVFTLCAGTLMAEPAVPEQGLKAEMAGEWGTALTVYQCVLGQQPQRGELWVRPEDIYHHLNREDDKLYALEQAAKAAPGDAAVAFRLSQAFAMANRPADAVEQCLRAAELESGNLEYLHACLQQANWANNRIAAQTSIQWLLQVAPGDHDALLTRAQWHSWTEIGRAHV